MASRRWVVVGGRTVDPGVVALLHLAGRAGLEVRAAAIRPPEGWDRLAPPERPGTLLATAVQHLTRRVLRGGSAELTDVLAADPWLSRQLGGTPAGTEPVLVGADDDATQALAAWRSATAGTGAGVQILTWDQGALDLAEQIAARDPRDGGQAPSPIGEPGPDGRDGPDPGAMVRVAVAVTRGQAVRPEILAALPAVRAKGVQLPPGAPVPERTDVLVLDGVGPAVAQLDLLPPRVRVVHLPRPTDRSTPWALLLAAAGGRVDRRATPDELDGPDPGGGLGAVLVGADTARLAGLRTAGDDDGALALARDLLAGPGPDEILLREIVYLARVTGSPSLELDALRAQQRHRDDAVLRRALERVTDRLRETDPGWLPDLPPTPVDPVPGRVLHLLKVTLPQRQAGYSVRGHHTLVALAGAGVDVVGVALPATAQAAPQAPTEPEEVVLDGVRYLIPPALPASGTAAHLEAAARALLPVVARERPAVLHVHSGHRGYDLGVVGAALARATGLPWVYEVRGLFESTWTGDRARAERGELYERRREREADLVRRADATVTLAETMRADLAARGVPEERLSVVPNAVDPSALAPRPRDEHLARRLDAVGRFTFGYVSNLDHAREQVEDLVRAAVLLHSRGLPTLALVVGTGTREEELRRLVADLGATGLVTFTGRVPHDRVAAHYGLLDVLVVPRGDERAARLVTPLKPFEAMAMGVPVVVSDQPALLEVIGDGARGWSYPTGDAAALADLLASLAADPEGRAQVAARAREWVTSRRTWAANARAYREVYARITPDAG